MIDMLEHTAAVDPQKDHVVRNLGIIMNTPDQTNDPCKSGNFSELEGYTGRPLATFLNYTVENAQRADFSVIMSGMSKPINRISECTEIAKECEALNNTDTASVSDELADLSAIKSTRNDANRNRILGVSSVRNDKAKLTDIPDIF